MAFAQTLEEREEAVRALDLASPTCRIAIRCVPRSQKGSMAAKACLGQCIRGLVSYEETQLRLLLVVSASGYRLLLESPAAPDEAAWLDAMHKPHNYVVSLPVRIAQAMLDLTLRPGDTVLDAFCGTGTIPPLARITEFFGRSPRHRRPRPRRHRHRRVRVRALSGGPRARARHAVHDDGLDAHVHRADHRGRLPERQTWGPAFLERGSAFAGRGGPIASTSTRTR